MKRHYFLGLAAGRKVGAAKQLFTIGRKKHLVALEKALSKRYDGTAILCKNGRSGLAIALESYFEKGDGIIVNGFTCYAVVEAIEAAGCVPVYADITKEDLNFNVATLKKLVNKSVKGIIIQNTLGNPVDIVEIEKFAKKNKLLIIEDLAHCAGVRYPDKREVGTVGVATVLSFGKDKSIDTTSGGAVVLRDAKYANRGPRPSGPSPRADGAIPRAAALRNARESAYLASPRLCDSARARWYPTLAAWCRGLARLHLCGALMRLFVKLHFVEKSADNKLDTSRRCTKWQAKLALEQIKDLRRTGEGKIRDYYLVNERDKCLKELKKAGYHFDGFWYERPVSPERYYKKVHFPEKECPVATEVAAQIINMPRYYPRTKLEKARKIIESYLVEEEK